MTTQNIPPPAIETGSVERPHIHQTWEVGDRAPQGDLYFVRVARLPKSAKLRTNRQLADGTTQGSRHVLDGGRVYDADPTECAAMVKDATGIEISDRYMGPVIAGDCAVRHPQHQDQCFPDHESTIVIHQRNLDAEEREIRAID